MECSDFMNQLRSFKPQSLGCAVARRKSSTTLIFPLPPQACSGMPGRTVTIWNRICGMKTCFSLHFSKYHNTISFMILQTSSARSILINLFQHQATGLNVPDRKLQIPIKTFGMNPSQVSLGVYVTHTAQKYSNLLVLAD